MATLLAMTNRVLRRLREEAVATLANDDYPLLIAEFVSDVEQEVKETGPGWSIFDHTVNVDLTDGTREYDLTATVANGGNVVNGDSVTTERSVMQFDQDGLVQAWVFDDSSDDTGHRMQYLDPNTLERLYQFDRDNVNTEPLYFTLERTSSGANSTAGWLLKLWPEPDASRRIRIKFNTPSARLDPDADEAVEITLPDRPIYLGALFMAMNERGEELGEPGSLLERRYISALAAAVENEIRVRERAGYYDWERV